MTAEKYGAESSGADEKDGLSVLFVLLRVLKFCWECGIIVGETNIWKGNNMGLFFNYTKPGPGVNKGEPRRKGVGLYFELFFRSFGKLCLANIIYFATSLPVMAIYFIASLYFLGVAMPELSPTAIFQASIIITLIVSILWGTGPASSGFTYILRNTAREEHFFTISDFFEKMKESLKKTLAFLVIDLVMFISSAASIYVYGSMAKTGGAIYSVLLFGALITLFFYTIMHFYMYEFEITFENSFIQIYKNSIIMSLATLPMCIVITLVVYFATTLILGFLNPVVVLIIVAFFWLSMMRFVVDFYAARTIKKKILPRYENQ